MGIGREGGREGGKIETISIYMYVQGSPLIYMDTNGTEESVIVSEVSSFQRLKCMQEWYSRWEKVSCLERCPYRVFHCTYNGVAPSTAKNHITKQSISL